MAKLGKTLVLVLTIPLASLGSSCSGSSETQTSGVGGSAQSGGTSGQSGSAGSSQAGTGAGQSGASGAGSGGSGSVMCEPGCINLCQGGLCDCYCEPNCADFTAPVYDKSCMTDDDCFAGVHTLDCCGSKQVLGFNIASQDGFDTYEADCTSRAVCRCAPAEPTLESGQVTSDLDLRFAVCSAGQCVGSGPVFTGAP